MVYDGYWTLLQSIISIFTIIANAVVTVMSDPVWIGLSVGVLIGIIILRLIF